MSHEHEVWQLLDKLQMDARQMSARITELRGQVAALDLPDPVAHICPSCGLKFRGPSKLAEHIYTSHDGPLPAHYVTAEERADEEHLVGTVMVAREELEPAADESEAA